MDNPHPDIPALLEAWRAAVASADFNKVGPAGDALSDALRTTHEARVRTETLANTLDAEAADLRQRAKTERDPQIAAQLFGEEYAKADAAGRIRAVLEGKT